MTSHLHAVSSAIRRNPGASFLIGAMAALCLWVYWPAFDEMAEKWSSDSNYSHGYLVPAFALVLLAMRRRWLTKVQLDWNYWGLPLILCGGLGYVVGAYFYVDWIEAMSLLPTAAGLFILFGGWAALRWSWPAIAFLAFMVPLPHRVETAFAQPLWRMATQGSTWLLQLVGVPAVAEGNIIHLNSGQIAVVEACNGLSMMLVFVALSTAIAILIQRPLVDRLVIVASAVPIAVGVNIVRIALNGIAMEAWGSEVANRLFHDQAGWLMMPMALVLLGLELWIMKRLLVEPPSRANLFVTSMLRERNGTIRPGRMSPIAATVR